jgi:catechol 2,3-dioxygenase-like lactoylglutathione lyase family enzyme
VVTWGDFSTARPDLADAGRALFFSLITLGVTDVSRARAFYEALGWEGESPDGEVVFFQIGGMVLALADRARLAVDSTVADGGGWGGVTLGYNVADAEGVDAVLAGAEAAGGRIGRPGAPTSWGGYSGVFIDPDGHPWEVAHNLGWVLGTTGDVRFRNDIVGEKPSAHAAGDQPRPAQQRKADTLAKFAERHNDIWVASAPGAVHLVPLSFAWTGSRIIIVTEEASPTVQNITASMRARLALGPTRDVVVIDAEIDRTMPYEEAPNDLVASYRAQADWDPAQAIGNFVMVLLRPVRIQAWRGANEILGRTLTRHGQWLPEIRERDDGHGDRL